MLWPFSDLQADGFGLGVKFQCLVAHLAASTGLFVAPKGERGIEGIVAVDPDSAGAMTAHHRLGAFSGGAYHDFADLGRAKGDLVHIRVGRIISGRRLRPSCPGRPSRCGFWFLWVMARVLANHDC